MKDFPSALKDLTKKIKVHQFLKNLKQIERKDRPKEYFNQNFDTPKILAEDPPLQEPPTTLTT